MTNFENIYYAPPHFAAYSASKNLKHAVRKNLRRAAHEWLESQDAYTLHVPVRRKFPRRFYNVYNIDDVWEIDLIDFRSISTYNDNYNYVLIAIDVLSKYAWSEPSLNKTGTSVANAFEKILKKSNDRSPVILQSDLGGEFVSRRTQAILQKYNITYRSVRCPDTKAAVVERFIRTIKERLWRYFTHHRTYRYVEILPKLIESYNKTRHSATQMIPAHVTLLNSYKARENLKKKYDVSEKKKKKKRPKYAVGDLVRISLKKNVFAKAYEGGWLLEIFKVSRISDHRQPIVYYLKDLADEPVKGYYYEAELNRVRNDLNSEIFEVDKILEEKGQGKRKKYFVSWLGYPAKFNSWVNASAIKDLQNG